MQGKVFVDGGSRGNPGPAGIGGIVQGDIPIKVSRFIGNTTNNVAEYTALVETVKEAVSKGYTELDIYADSELMVRQIQGKYKVKNEGLKPLFMEAQKYLQQLKSYTITHIVRELNTDADSLVNEALDHELA